MSSRTAPDTTVSQRGRNVNSKEITRSYSGIHRVRNASRRYFETWIGFSENLRGIIASVQHSPSRREGSAYARNQPKTLSIGQPDRSFLFRVSSTSIRRTSTLQTRGESPFMPLIYRDWVHRIRPLPCASEIRRLQGSIRKPGLRDSSSQKEYSVILGNPLRELT